MAPAMSGPTKCSAEPDHGASSTCLPSSRVKVTLGSSAAAAMNKESATDLPAPGSPPSKRLRSGSATLTGLPSSSTPSDSGSHREPRGPGHGGAGTESGSLKRIETWASEAFEGSRTTRTSRAPMAAAIDSPASSSSSAVRPGGSRSCKRRPAGMDSVPSTRGIEPRRLMSSQAIRTRLNQRAVARSRSVRASHRLSLLERQRAMPRIPSTRIPRPSPPRATPRRQSTNTPVPKATSSPHPRTASAIRE